MNFSVQTCYIRVNLDLKLASKPVVRLIGQYSCSYSFRKTAPTTKSRLKTNFLGLLYLIMFSRDIVISICMIGNLEYRMVLIAKIGLTLTNRRFLTQIPALPSSNEWGASALLAYSSTMRKLRGDQKIRNQSTKPFF